MKGVVAYQGEPGAYAHEACRTFLPGFERINRPTFESVADAVVAGEADLGMLPVENNSAGQVPGNRDLIARKGLEVRDEVVLPIRLHLMAVPGARLEEIDVVVSHPIALAQCHQVLERLGATAEEAINTAVGARLLAGSGDRRKAAVASEAAAVANGLDILCRNVHDRPDNATTFCIVAQRGPRMSVNSFGRLFRVSTWGESHGPAIGALVDGCPPGLALSEDDIQPWLDRRRPGTSRFTSQRREPDQVRILSGVYEGRTTGTPISLVIDNVDQRPKDYDAIAGAYRPGHADFAYEAKYGLRDPRGGGRASARETAARVAAGGVARLVIPEVSVRAYLVELGGDTIDRAAFDEAEIDRNPFFCPDTRAAARWEALLDSARKAGDSLGAVVECVASGVPAGWGAPVFAKLDAELAAAAMSINAVKAVEIGDGFAAARATGRDNADEMRAGTDGRPDFLANHNGGIAGGIATGQPIVVRAAFKPTSSIPTALRTIDRAGSETDIATGGRHDPCVGIRGAPVVEAMVALVLTDQKLLHRAQCGGG